MVDFNKAVGDAEKVYNVAEAEVDGFFVRNKYTVLILSAVAIALVVFAVL
jgi:hypothetical protein